MQNLTIAQQFAMRLKEAMLRAGFNSHRSPTGVSMPKLVEITGYSPQICRRYLKGEAIPEPGKLQVIALKLKVSPGWLLFGSAHDEITLTDDDIIIKRNLLHYVFKKAILLYSNSSLGEDVPNFLMELIDDVRNIEASEAQSKKIIDLVVDSIKHFK